MNWWWLVISAMQLGVGWLLRMLYDALRATPRTKRAKIRDETYNVWEDY